MDLAPAVARRVRRRRRKRHNHVEPSRVAVWSTTDEGHRHRLVFDEWGNGWSDVVQGHRHRIHWLDLAPVNGHTHEQTAARAPLGADLDTSTRRV